MLRQCVFAALLHVAWAQPADQSGLKAVPDDPFMKENFVIKDIANKPDSVINRMWSAITRGGPYTKPGSAPKEIPAARSIKPDDWSDEDDGAWEPEMVPNPDYKASHEFIELLEKHEKEGPIADVAKRSITLLQWATYNNNTEAVKILLEYKANPNLVNENGDSALSNAVMWGNLDHVDMLLKAGAKPTTLDRNFLDEAISSGKTDIAIRLLDGGAHPNFGGQIQNAIRNCHHLECQKVIAKLLEKNADPIAELKIRGRYYTPLKLVDIVETAGSVRKDIARHQRVLKCREHILKAMGGKHEAYKTLERVEHDRNQTQALMHKAAAAATATKNADPAPEKPKPGDANPGGGREEL
jgi:hypothetical protein